ncbi:MAG: hypothetical protein Kow00117_15560 [Phototrophicales bacterium]
MIRNTVLLISFLIILTYNIPITGQSDLFTPPPPAHQPDWEDEILDAINARRIDNTSRLVPLVRSALLDSIADYYLQELYAEEGFNYRILNNPASFEGFLAQNFDDLLSQLRSGNVYPDGYYDQSVNVVLFSSGTLGPENFVNHWYNNNNLSNYRNQSNLPFLSQHYREIGIAYHYSLQKTLHYYVIILAAFPNQFPIGTSTLSEPANLVTEFDGESSILLHISSETIEPDGITDVTIGRPLKMRILDYEPNNNIDDCRSRPDFIDYTPSYEYRLPPGIGERTIYVQLCDDIDRLIPTSVTINIISEAPPTPTPTPTLMPTNTTQPTLSPTPTQVSIAVPTTTPPPTPMSDSAQTRSIMPTDIATTEIILAWSGPYFVALNSNQHTRVDLTDFNLQGITNYTDWSIEIDPQTGFLYNLHEVPPGACLVLQLTNDPINLADFTITCSKVIATRILTTGGQDVWNNDTFTTWLGDTCVGWGRNRCTVKAPISSQ